MKNNRLKILYFLLLKCLVYIVHPIWHQNFSSFLSTFTPTWITQLLWSRIGVLVARWNWSGTFNGEKHPLLIFTLNTTSSIGFALRNLIPLQELMWCHNAISTIYASVSTMSLVFAQVLFLRAETAHSFQPCLGSKIMSILKVGLSVCSNSMASNFTNTSFFLIYGGTAPQISFLTVCVFFLKITTDWWEVK